MGHTEGELKPWGSVGIRDQETLMREVMLDLGLGP